MDYEEYLKSPDVSKAYNVMFEKQVEHFRNVSRELGIKVENLESFSIKMASVSTEMHFSRQFSSKSKND